MHAIKTLALLAITAAPTSALASSDNAAEVLDFTIEHEGCVDAVLYPPPGQTWEPIEMTHCVELSNDFHIVKTSAGISVRRIDGDMYFIDYNADGDVISESEREDMRFDVTYFEEGEAPELMVARVDRSHCTLDPAGNYVQFEVMRQYAGDEWVISYHSFELVDEC